MTQSTTTIQEFVTNIYPFNQLPTAVAQTIASKIQTLRYRMGQPIFVRETIPDKIVIIYSGQARLLGYAPGAKAPETLQRFKSGEIIGWTGLVRGISCETVIASDETLCLTLAAVDFLKLLASEPDFAAAFRNKCSIIEIYDLLGAEFQCRAIGNANLKELAIQALNQAVILNLSQSQTPCSQLEPNLLWLVSGGACNFPIGTRIEATDSQEYILAVGSIPTRLIGLLPLGILESEASSSQKAQKLEANNIWDDAPYAPPSPTESEINSTKSTVKYPHVRGRGPVDATLACFQMLSQYLNTPWKKDVLKRALDNNFQRTGKISIELCGAVAELMGFKSQLVEVPAVAISKLPTPVLLPWQDSFVILYHATEKELVLAIPEQGIVRKKPAAFIDVWGEDGQVLLIQSTPETPKKRFNLSWFLPAIKKHKTVLIEVFIASLFVQLLGLANPLVTQVIIDKVIIQNGVNTLNVLGFVLIAMAIIEGIITWLRTNLFVDTTNRIDLSLGSEVIDHLLRLPLRYFEKRPVGEISSRINELENIRSFLTGTALTVVLDAIFSVVYIVVMIFYSWLLTIVALATVPLFALLTFIFAPIIRSQTRTKAERNAETQSYAR